MPAMPSMAVTAIPVPNRPPNWKVAIIPATMTIAGMAVDSSETARPWMTLVP